MPTDPADTPNAEPPRPIESPQARWKCACPAWTTGRGCYQRRYAESYAESVGRGHMNMDGDVCECACHETEEDSDV
jgi:hypothetical protein